MSNPNKLRRAIGAYGAVISLGAFAAATGIEQPTHYPNDQRLIQRIEALPLPWHTDSGPSRQHNHVEADVTLSTGEEVQISLFSKKPFRGRLPAASNVLQADLAVYPVGTDITNMDAQPKREYILWDGTFFNNGDYVPNGLTTQAYYSSVAQPAYPAPKQMGGDVVMTSNYTAKSYEGVRNFEHVSTDPLEAKRILSSIQSQALALANAAAYGHAMPQLEELFLPNSEDA